MSLSPPMNDDAALVELARGGSREAFSELVGRHQGAVRGFAARLMQDLDAADDVAQEAFLAAFRNLYNQQRDREFLSWLLGITRHKALSYLRQRIRRRNREGRTLESALAAAHLSRAETMTVAEETEDWLPRLRQCLERLAPHSRNLVEQHYFRGQTAESLAAVTGQQSSAIRMALLRVRAALGKCLRNRSQVKE